MENFKEKALHKQQKISNNQKDSKPEDEYSSNQISQDNQLIREAIDLNLENENIEDIKRKKSQSQPQTQSKKCVKQEEQKDLNSQDSCIPKMYEEDLYYLEVFLDKMFEKQTQKEKVLWIKEKIEQCVRNRSLKQNSNILQIEFDDERSIFNYLYKYDTALFKYFLKDMNEANEKSLNLFEEMSKVLDLDKVKNHKSIIRQKLDQLYQTYYFDFYEFKKNLKRTFTNLYDKTKIQYKLRQDGNSSRQYENISKKLKKEYQNDMADKQKIIEKEVQKQIQQKDRKPLDIQQRSSGNKNKQYWVAQNSNKQKNTKSKKDENEFQIKRARREELDSTLTPSKSLIQDDSQNQIQQETYQDQSSFNVFTNDPQDNIMSISQSQDKFVYQEQPIDNNDQILLNQDQSIAYLQKPVNQGIILEAQQAQLIGIQQKKQKYKNQKIKSLQILKPYICKFEIKRQNELKQYRDKLNYLNKLEAELRCIVEQQKTVVNNRDSQIQNILDNSYKKLNEHNSIYDDTLFQLQLQNIQNIKSQNQNIQINQQQLNRQDSNQNESIYRSNANQNTQQQKQIQGQSIIQNLSTDKNKSKSKKAVNNIK